MDVPEATSIAILARRFRLLAERPNLLYPEPEQRAARVLDDPVYMGWSVFDLLLVAGADETDRLCAQAVATIPSHANKAVVAILDLLSVLPAERVLAIYHALPRKARSKCERHEVWAYRIAHAPPGVDTAEAHLAPLAHAPRLLDTAELPFTERLDYERFSSGLVRRTLGLSHGLTPEQEQIANEAEALLNDVLG